MKTIEINGETFEVVKPRNKVNPVTGYITDKESIFCWYDRPSIYKVGIWKNWVNWAYATDGVDVFEIASANCMQFTIKGHYISEDGTEYNLYITKAHNRAILVED